ncbi:23S rRNA (pseudouridine(1915)-N(3))-methyltransferase RlmH [Thiohalobacter sp. IOR34]|uniref:23S rRNA (pseudouridine(1915)-N(3))-methyltransferase RlmH n=1 Tax=Thiohalobacter sp. IOR34 TaxID=3057176 RepID=UPI0025B256FA|nr:23S rRNA (pseudouridine(1915)-N(3))-methyltransferase RlmH [Thiohalobacter sp. IOR34]WJW74877.1 23S rRNA (pseudouridine(1915)-N(3))-methyltransferase RlmH [Thiohalobacter sp. IOR34]
MRIRLIAVGRRMPDWVTAGYQEYARRLPRECALELIEIAPGHRGRKADVRRILQEEGERMLAAIPRGSRVIALEVGGRPWSTPQLAERLGDWLAGGQDIALLVGGPEGLDPACRARADEQWSLSPLTLPHPLVRVLLAEQLYRAWSLRAGHPYHRA